MNSDSISASVLQPDADTDEHHFDNWFDPIENAARDQMRSFIEELIEGELAAVLASDLPGDRHRAYLQFQTGTLFEINPAVKCLSFAILDPAEQAWVAWIAAILGRSGQRCATGYHH